MTSNTMSAEALSSWVGTNSRVGIRNCLQHVQFQFQNCSESELQDLELELEGVIEIELKMPFRFSDFFNHTFEVHSTYNNDII